ncbi:WD40 repeat-like protein [Basidiobolus meristosporus CBS 931.73]|uniref:Probable cytosolic iron-sulfur protein assembly protein 1 n=1 Tax=Basidiobolus meristosporus CBS 931.73 TaxID=1314790 RepID=A0A1Y1XZ75_9FUNG|nr:WD40 repeat-like protein [Basidiobolus meristosporus CBS 931.73]|eukprot:ORX91038.1 WD40 repeat-like protein [Basidiobolus meristosporus CBS 931.73]
MPRLELIAELEGHEDRVWQVSWDPSGTQLASCSGDKTVRLWVPDEHNPGKASWNCVGLLEGFHERTIRSVQYSPSGQVLATGSFDGTTGIWDKSESIEFDCVATLEGHENEVKSVAWSATGSLIATCSRDKSVWIWEAASYDDFECLAVLQEHTQDVKTVKWHPNEEILASAGYDDTIKIWEEQDDDWYCTATLEGHKSTVWAVDFDSRGDRLVSASDDKTLKIWKHEKVPKVHSFNPSSWRCVTTLEGYHKRAIYSVSWSKHHGHLVSGGDDNATSPEDAENQFEVVATVEGAHGVHDVNSVVWNPNEEFGYIFASGGDDGVVRVWQYIP